MRSSEVGIGSDTQPKSLSLSTSVATTFKTILFLDITNMPKMLFLDITKLPYSNQPPHAIS